MSESESAPPVRTSHGDTDGVLRLDLLSRFSEQEIQRLCALQLRTGARPQALDRSIEEGRLQFARWLVQHGRLREGVETNGDNPSSQQDLSCAKWPHEDRPHEGCRSSSGMETTVAFAGAGLGSPTREPAPHATTQQRPSCRSPVDCVWTWMRQGLVRAAGAGRWLASCMFIPTEEAEIDPLSLRDPYGSHWSYIDDPWPWTHFRRGW